MDEENKSYEDDQIYHEDFDDDFEIGIPIDESLNPSSPSEFPESKPENEPENLMVTETADDTAPEANPETYIEEADTGPSDDDLNAESSSFEEISAIDFPEQMPPDPSGLDEIKDQLKELSKTFESKLRYDEHKNKIIDDLHKSLQEYREGLVKKYLHRIVTDIIKIVDDMRKFTSHYKDQPASEETSAKLHKYIENIASDLEDLFAWEGVVPFNSEGETFDPSRQRILNKIETDDPEKDKTVAERLRPGYEWDGKIIRPEMVSVYIYQTESTAEDNNH